MTLHNALWRYLPKCEFPLQTSCLGWTNKPLVKKCIYELESSGLAEKSHDVLSCVMVTIVHEYKCAVQ